MCLRFMHWVEKMQDGFALLPEHIKVSYYYYDGLLNLFQYNYMKALKSLSYSLDNSKKEPNDFQGRVTRYLVPLNILFGDFPEAKFLEEHKLPEYVSIAKACQSGDLVLFEKALAENEEIFLKTSIYLVMEKLKNVVYRNFFQNVYEENESNHIIKLDLILQQFNKAIEEHKKTDKEAEELEEEVSYNFNT